MLRIPQKQSLEKQTAAILREQIAQGTWPEWLPGERSLCEMLQVSRHTLRGALRQLKLDGQITAEAGLGNRITGKVVKPKGTKLASLDVGLLISDELEVLRPMQVTWIDHLRGMLAERGCRLHLFHGRKYAQRDPSRAIKQLMAIHPHRCWILLLSVRSTQEWFQANHVPCVVAGSLYSGISLPFCDVDHYAVCRHAAGTFTGKGHRHLALVVKKSQWAGDIESEAGFADGVRQAGAEVSIANHDATPAGINAAVKRLMQQSPRPTAIMISNAFHYLSVISTLAKLSFRIPEDVSVVSRDGEQYLSYLLPTPAYYGIDAKVFAKTLLVQVLQLLEGGLVSKRASLIMPEFRAGQSIASMA